MPIENLGCSLAGAGRKKEFEARMFSSTTEIVWSGLASTDNDLIQKERSYIRRAWNQARHPEPTKHAVNKDMRIYIPLKTSILHPRSP